MLPEFVEEGFHRPDLALAPGLQKPAAVGQFVKVQLQLSRPLLGDTDEEVTWALMAGPVQTVPREDCVIACVRLSTDPAVEELMDEWIVTLHFDDECEYPWVLADMVPRMAN